MALEQPVEVLDDEGADDLVEEGGDAVEELVDDGVLERANGRVAVLLDHTADDAPSLLAASSRLRSTSAASIAATSNDGCDRMISSFIAASASASATSAAWSSSESFCRSSS